MFGIGLALVAAGVALLQSELRSAHSSGFYTAVSVVAVAAGLLCLGITAYEHFLHRHDGNRTEGEVGIHTGPTGDIQLDESTVEGFERAVETEGKFRGRRNRFRRNQR